MPGSRSAASDDVWLQLQVLRCQAGDEEAFAQLFSAFGVRTLRYLRGLVGDTADDVQQETWIAVYRGISTLNSPGAFRTWLFRTARHRAIDHLRRQKREGELLAEEALEETMAAGAAEPDSAGLDTEDLEQVLAALPQVQREALLLRFRDDLSYAEIALVVGCSIGTVRSRLHHGKRSLQELIDG